MKRKRGQEEQNTSPKIENINTIFFRNGYMAYSQSFIHHIAGLSGINIVMTSSQLVC